MARDVAHTPAPRPSGSLPQRPTGVRRVGYWVGRGLQGFGLLLIWWVLLLFASTTEHAAWLYGGVAAAVVVFYSGWVCIAWAKKGR